MSVLSIRDIEGSLDQRLVEAALREKNAVTDQQLAVALAKQRSLAEAGERAGLCEILLRDRFLNRPAALEFVQSLANAEIDAADEILTDEICKRYAVRPLQVVGGVLHLAAVKPLLPAQLDVILAAAKVRLSDIKVVPVDRLEHQAHRRRVAATGATLPEALARLKREEVSSEGLRAVINALLTEASLQRASDIHIDCQPDPNSWISFRVDGRLRQYAPVPERLMAAIFTRLKTLGGMDASDKLRPQDGRITHVHKGRQIDLRMASQPIVGGETITLRLLDPDSLPSISQLFAGQPEMAEFFSGLARFNGKNGCLVLISGPTGSGKTATLYTLLQRFERDRFNVITVEDPVEYTVSFARQIQLNQILKQRAVDIESSLLRHDPDIIVFGEVRNYDMALAVLKLAESGHMVLATIHAGSAMQTHERFLSFFPQEAKRDAGYILGHYLRTIINQRLVPRLCKCAEPASPGSSEKVAVGCPTCDHTGYIGRVVAHDSVLLPSDEARRAPIAKAIADAGSRLDGALSCDGARHIARSEVLASLVASGAIDEATRRRVMEG